MGQVALGLRSLLIKLTIFVVMAALLAWALGGSLFPRARTWETDGVSFAGAEWSWRLVLPRGGEVRWELIRRSGDERVEIVDAGPWLEVAGPIATGEGLLYGGRSAVGPRDWRLGRFDVDLHQEWFPMVDRLAVERQLERVRRGLLIQSAETIDGQRPHVLDPPDVP